MFVLLFKLKQSRHLFVNEKKKKYVKKLFTQTDLKSAAERNHKNASECQKHQDRRTLLVL